VIRDVRGNVRDWPTGYEAVMAALLGKPSANPTLDRRAKMVIQGD
jgi:hypothetical protein